MDNVELLELEEVDFKVLLEAIFDRYGYDFRKYNFAHVKRRLKRRLFFENMECISDLRKKIINDEEFFKIILHDLSINITEMFRYPLFFKEIREGVVPILKTYPSVRIWHAGCSTGEEVYSMAILLKEEGLLNRTKIFATDFNSDVLEVAKSGIYPIRDVKKWTRSYQDSGGKESFSKYYTARYNSVIFDSELVKNVTFSEHNLVHDKSFMEVHLVICRNVLIYFNSDLQTEVIELFYDSIKPGGFLGLGDKENVRASHLMSSFDVFSKSNKIFKKKLLR
ncbi:protein-glutamate O-methyltransferase CheR [Mycoplasmatota bacterium WC44]